MASPQTHSDYHEFKKQFSEYHHAGPLSGGNRRASPVLKKRLRHVTHQTAH
jgi:hypothetical protein